MSVYQPHSLDSAIAEFFSQTSVTRQACDVRAKNLVGGEVLPVPIQGSCSYSVYAGYELEYVVQFRLKSLALESDVAILAHEIYGSLAPRTAFHGHLGDDGTESLFVYVMSRIHGNSYLEFVLTNDFPENSKENFLWRKTLLFDVARYGSNTLSLVFLLNSLEAPSLHFKRSLIRSRFFALSWKSPQKVGSDFLAGLRQTYVGDLQLLLRHLPPRFHRIIQNCLDSMEAILSLPIVLLHRDFSTMNIMVDKTTCHLTGVID